MRKSNRKVQFHNPFSLKGGELILPPGTYSIKVDEAPAKVGPVKSWETVAVQILVPSAGGVGEAPEWVTVDVREFQTEVALDGVAKSG